jgi:hypothetical protein
MPDWVAPRSWAVSEEVTAAKLNEVRDELNHLFSEASLTGFDYPATCDARLATGFASVGIANFCHYNRITNGGVITALRINVGVSNGTIGVAVYDQTNIGINANPNARTATTGSIACPAAGISDVALGGSFTVGHATHWFALSASGTTATFSSAGSIPVGWHNGVNAAQAAAHPPPATATPATNGSLFFVILGV